MANRSSDALVDTTEWLDKEVLHRALPGRVYRARIGARERTERSNEGES